MAMSKAAKAMKLQAMILPVSGMSRKAMKAAANCTKIETRVMMWMDKSIASTEKTCPYLTGYRFATNIPLPGDLSIYQKRIENSPNNLNLKLNRDCQIFLQIVKAKRVIIGSLFSRKESKLDASPNDCA